MTTTYQEQRIAASLSAEVGAVLRGMAKEDPTLRKVFHELFGTTPAWRYYGKQGAYGAKRPGNLYFYTTQTRIYQGRPRYASGVYRYLQSRRVWRSVNLRWHAKRRDAKARALSLYESERPG